MKPQIDPILLIEDDPVFASVLARALRRRGYTVNIATDAAQALAIVRETPPRAAVVDLKLGEDSGLALIPQLQALAPQTRILMLTGYASIATAVCAIKKGAFDYLPKPAGADAVIAALTGTEQTDPEADEQSALSPRRLMWEHIQRVLAEHDGNISAAARAMGMHRRSLQRRLAKRPVQR